MRPTRVRVGPAKQVLLPARWQRDMTPEEVEAYYEAYHGQQGEAVGTGWLLDQLVVIDLDGPAAIDLWQTEVGIMSPYRVRTPGRGGGLHLYFRLPHPGLADVLRGIRVPAGEHAVEVKAGWTSMVVVPPSPHPNGGTYEWVDAPLVEIEDAPVLPAEVVTWLRQHQERGIGSVTTAMGGGWDAIPVGHRNNALTQLAGYLRGLGASAKVISHILHGINASALMEPDEAGQKLSRRAIDGIVERAMGWEPGTIDLLEDVDDDLEIPLTAFDDMLLPDPPTWLWHPYVPENRLILVDGRGGIGKGLWCAWLAWAVMRGADPVTGEEVRPAGSVLWFPAEDDPREDLGPRLRALGWRPGAEVGRSLTPDQAVPGSHCYFPRDTSRLLTAIEKHDIKLIILDPGRAYLGPAEGMSWRDFTFNNDAHVRPGLQSLQRLAHEARVTILFVHHWNKDRSGSTTERATGSAAFSDVVRHRVTLAEINDERVLAVNKSNIAKRAHTVHSYWVEEVLVAEGLTVPRFVLGEPLPEFVDLDAWEKHARQSGGVEMVWSTDDLDDWLRQEGYAPPFKLPGRDDLGKFVGISYRHGRQLHQAAASDPRFVRLIGDGGGLYWTGGASVDPAVLRAMARTTPEVSE